MTDYAYAMGTGKIGSLFNKIHDVGLPSAKVTQVWLAQVGFGSSNDRRLIGVLKQVGFLDAAGLPTDAWKTFRSAGTTERKRVFAMAIRDGYSDLFAFYPDAHARNDSDVDAYFRGHVTAGAAVLNKTIQTFRALVAIADFSSSAAASPAAADTAPLPKAEQKSPDPLPAAAAPPILASGMSVVVNIQLAVPETKDPKVYDAFFESLRKHVLS